MVLDVYVDAGSYQNNFSIGIVFYALDIEVYKVSEKLKPSLQINSIQNAELYAIDKALAICKEASISEKEIFIHCDNEQALTAAKVGTKFKNCNQSIYGHIVTYKGQLTKNFNNALHFVKITSDQNHGKAHDLASDALNDNEYIEGNKHYLALNSNDIKRKLLITSKDTETNISNQSQNTLFNTQSINEILDNAGNSFISLQEDLFKKKSQIMDLKIKLIQRQSILKSLLEKKGIYLNSLHTLKNSINEAKIDETSISNKVKDNLEILNCQEKKLSETDTKINLAKEKLKTAALTEDIRLSMYQEEYERLIKEIDYIKSAKNIKCEVM